MSSPMRSRMFVLGLLLPLGLAIFLSFINPDYMFTLFSNGQGWLIMCNFFLMIALNVLIIQRVPVQATWRMPLILVLALIAVACALFGPAYLRMIPILPQEGASLKTAVTLSLILMDAGFVIAILALATKLFKKNADSDA